VARTVYVETSIISYLAAHPSRDLIVAARQQLTHTWWRQRRPAFEVYVSQVVLDEALAGDQRPPSGAPRSWRGSRCWISPPKSASWLPP